MAQLPVNLYQKHLKPHDAPARAYAMRAIIVIQPKISKIKGDADHVFFEVSEPQPVLLKPFLVSFGAAVEVLEPINLRH